MSLQEIFILSPQIRSTVFIFGFCLFFLLGLMFPFRSGPRKNINQRWTLNFLFGIINGVFVAVLIPLSLVAFAQLCEHKGWGLFNYLGYNENTNLWALIAGFVLFDGFIYFQHFCTHKIPILWRLHRFHHSDIEFDTTTASRFHLLEILFSYFLKIGFVFLIGPGWLSVLIFESLLNFCSMFNHSNFKIMDSIEKLLRLLIVTPSMHRVHHSVLEWETNSNYSFCLSIWDRMFRTYKKDSINNPKEMKIGLCEFRDNKDQSLIELLLQPFR